MESTTHHLDEARPGDWIETHGPRLGGPGRTGQILEVLGRPGHEHFRVRWDEEHQSIFYPADGEARILRHPHAPGMGSSAGAADPPPPKA